MISREQEQRHGQGRHGREYLAGVGRHAGRHAPAPNHAVKPRHVPSGSGAQAGGRRCYWKA